VRRAGQIRQPAQDWIEQPEPHAAQPGIGSAGALGQDDLRPIAPLFDKLRDNFRRILEVAVDENDAIAPRVLQSRGHGRLVAEVPRQLDQLDARLIGVELADNLARSVAAAVIDQNDLPLFAALLQRASEPPSQLGQILLLIEDGGDDADHAMEYLPRTARIRLAQLLHVLQDAPVNAMDEEI